MSPLVRSKGELLIEGLKTVGALMVVLGSITLGLRILHLLPPYLSKEPMQTYATVEAARRSTGLPLYLPAYFPDYLRWPPEEIRGWTEPSPKISVTAVLQNSGRPVLWIEEWFPLDPESAPEVPRAMKIADRGSVDLQSGMKAELLSYVDTDGQLYYRLLWDQGSVRILLTAALPGDDLIRMAGSMHPPPSY